MNTSTTRPAGRGSSGWNRWEFLPSCPRLRRRKKSRPPSAQRERRRPDGRCCRPAGVRRVTRQRARSAARPPLCHRRREHAARGRREAGGAVPGDRLRPGLRAGARHQPATAAGRPRPPRGSDRRRHPRIPGATARADGFKAWAQVLKRGYEGLVGKERRAPTRVAPRPIGSRSSRRGGSTAMMGGSGGSRSRRSAADRSVPS
jgi:hypothetical protein